MVRLILSIEIFGVVGVFFELFGMFNVLFFFNLVFRFVFFDCRVGIIMFL